MTNTDTARIAAEREWIRKFATRARELRYTVSVDYMDGEPPIKCDTVDDVLRYVHACDMERLVLRHASKPHSWVLLVYGNADDGSEVFSDYGMSLDPLMHEIGYFDD